MKRHFSIFILTIYLFSFTEVKEVLKIPALIEHYQEHKSENKNISIIGFIALHYLSGSQKDSDYEKDMKLPFKAHEISSVSFAIQDLPKSFELNLAQTKKFFEEKNQNFHYAESFINPHLLSFFQPPELV